MKVQVMESKEFYSEIEKHIKSLEKEQIIDFVSNIIRKIPESKFEEILYVINSNNIKISKEEIKQKVKTYQKQFEKIEEGELYFYAEQYEDYSYGWDNWSIAYSDEDKVGDLITEVVQFAVKLVNYKEYHYAKELLDMVIETNYEAYDEVMGETFEISLLDMKENNLIYINISTLCLYLIYVTYQTSSSKEKDIYSYFKNNYIFRDISIQDSFKLGTEKLTDIEGFLKKWISFLSKIKGEIEYRLLKEALTYTNYIDYEKYTHDFTENQPKIYIDIFNHLKKENKIKELIDLGNEVLKTIDNKSKVGGDIALYLADIDIESKEKYICEAFMCNTNILNLLRIINNGYYKKHENDVKNQIAYDNTKEDDELNIISKETYYLLQFFIGNFEEFYNESIKHKELLGWTYSFERTSVYLWLLLLNETNEKTKSYSKLLSDIFSDIEYEEKENHFLEGSIDEIWKNWKSNFKLDENIKMKALKWLNKLIENRVEAILEGNYRKSYNKAALLVVAYSEVMASQKLGTKEEYIQYYKNKYPRRSAFKQEILSYL